MFTGKVLYLLVIYVNMIIILIITVVSFIELVDKYSETELKQSSITTLVKINLAT